MPNSTLVNLVRTLILNTGTDTLQLGQALPAFRGVEALTDGETYSYSIQQGSNYETGQGVFGAQNSTLTRGVIESSAGNGPITLAPNGVCAFTALDRDFQLPGRPGLPGSPGEPGLPGDPGTPGAGINMPVIARTTDYTLALSDANTYQQVDSDVSVIITVPPVNVVNFPTDIVIAIEQTGAGNVSVSPGAGVTIVSREDAFQTAGQGAVIQLKNTAQNQWTLLGDAGPFSGGIPDAPSDGQDYARKDGQWVPVADAGLPVGGTTGQVLTKRTSTDGDADWETPTGGGGVGGPIGPHRYWRIERIAPHDIGVGIAASELRFRSTAGGANLPVTAGVASSTYNGVGGAYDVSKLWDGDTNTLWSGTGEANNAFLSFDLGTAVAVQEIAITARNDGNYNQTPALFEVWYSDDNQNWKLATRVTLPAFTAQAQTQTVSVPATMPAGGAVTSLPTIVQSVYGRGGGQTLTLPNAPTLGNLLVALYAGQGGSPPSPPAGFTTIGFSCNGSALYGAGSPGTGNAFQGGYAAVKEVSDATAGFAFSNSGSDPHNFALLEITPANCFDFDALALSDRGGGIVYGPFMKPAFPALHLCFFEHDVAGVLSVAQSGLATLNAFNGGGNHAAALATAADTFTGEVRASYGGGSTSYPVLYRTSLALR